MTKSEINEPQERDFISSENTPTFKSYQSKTKPRWWKQTKPDLIKICFICDSQIQVKYILPKKQYSQKNLWGHWTQKDSDKHKYICNSCIMKLHYGSMSDWITNKNKADNFYNYIYRGSFDK